MAVVLASCRGLVHCGAKLCELTGMGYPAEGRGGVWQRVDGGLGGYQVPLWLFYGV